MIDPQIYEKFRDIGRDLYVANMISSHGGNMSVCYGDRIIIKRRGAMLGNLKRELGDLDRVTCWLRVFGMVNAAPGFANLPNVINGFSDLILELYGPEAGQHARSAVGMAQLPLGAPVEVEFVFEVG